MCKAPRCGLDLQIRRDRQGALLPLNQQALENINIDGLVPVILQIQPLPSVETLFHGSSLLAQRGEKC